MATVITSIGSKSIYTNPVNGQFAITGSSGSGDPWTGTVSHAGSSVTANVGDMLFFRQVHTDCGGWGGCTTGPVDVVYLITAVNSGSDSLTIKYISGLASASSGQAPTVLSSNSYTFTQAQPYVLRFYSTPGTWNADLENTGLYSSGDTAKGECYKDSALSQSSNLYVGSQGGNVTGITIAILSVAESQRHDGTAGTGYVINMSNHSYIMLYWDTDSGASALRKTLEWIEADGGELGSHSGHFVYNYSGGSMDYCGTVSHCLIHGHYNNLGTVARALNNHSKNSCAHNNIIYNIQGIGTVYGITMGESESVCCNNTVYKIHTTQSDSSSADKTAYGIQNDTENNIVMSNNIVGAVTSTVANEHYDYYSNGGTQTRNNNISEDGTADDYATSTDAITGVDPEDLFVDCTTAGSEDFHLKDGAQALRAGEDLGTSVTPHPGNTMGSSDFGTPINIDIDGRNRDSEGDDWDIGADQCEDCSGPVAAGNPAFLLFLDS